VLWLIDFGKSEIFASKKNQIGNLANYSLEAPEIYFIDIPLLLKDEKCISGYRKGFNSDMWSMGIMIVNMICSSIDIPNEIINGLSYEINEDLNNKIDLVMLRKIMIYRFFSLPIYVNEKSFELSRHFKDKFANYLDDIELGSIYTDYVLGICLFNKYLGNGLLPKEKDGYELVNNDIYQLLYEDKDILKSIGMINEEKHIFNYVIEWIRDKFYGDTGINLLKNLFSWNIFVRMNINDNKSNYSLFSKIMDSEIFGEYSSISEEINNNENIKSEIKSYTNGSINSVNKSDIIMDKIPYDCLELIHKKDNKAIQEDKKLEGYELELSNIENDINNDESFEEMIHKIINEAKERKIRLVSSKCTNCNKKNPSYVCECITAAYCNYECQIKDRERHRSYCLNRINKINKL
jgi:hypothetical protein